MSESVRVIGRLFRANGPVIGVDSGLVLRHPPIDGQGFGVFISPHYLYPADQAWQFGGAVEKMMLESKEFL